MKGWDWTELGPVFGIDIYDEKYQNVEINKKENLPKGEAILGNDIDAKLSQLMWALASNGERPINNEQKVQLKQLRKFAKAIYLNMSEGDKPLFKGLCDIKHNMSFVRWVCILRGYMWT